MPEKSRLHVYISTGVNPAGDAGDTSPNILVGGTSTGISPPILLRTFGYSRPILVALRSLSLKPFSFGYKTPPIRFSQAGGQSAHKARPPNLELALTPLTGGIQARNQAHRSLVPRELSCTTLSYRESRRDRWILAGRVSRGGAAADWWSRPRRSWSDECRASASETRTWREDSSTSPNLHSPLVQRRQYYHIRPEYAR